MLYAGREQHLSDGFGRTPNDQLPAVFPQGFEAMTDQARLPFDGLDASFLKGLALQEFGIPGIFVGSIEKELGDDPTFPFEQGTCDHFRIVRGSRGSGGWGRSSGFG